jgi:hypothetical protein
MRKNYIHQQFFSPIFRLMLQLLLVIYEIQGFHSSVNEKCGFPRCYAVSSSKFYGRFGGA